MTIADAPADRRPRLLKVLHFLEDALLVLTLTTMILCSFFQIALRNLLGLGLGWIEPLLRHLVLWIALLGAMIAARDDNHLSVDALTSFLPPRLRMTARVLTDLFTTLVCAVLCRASISLVRDFYDWPLPGSFGNQAWIFSLVLPLGFGVMALRYFFLLGLHLAALITGKIPAPRLAPKDEGPPASGVGERS